MPRKIRQLKADLRKVGAYMVSQEGSHTKWEHPLVPSKVLILSGHDGDDAKLYQEMAVRDLIRHIEQAKRRTDYEYRSSSLLSTYSVVR
jgi:predicted RNA binding protein YcfA (HicA-like mRNA interferase family)